MDDACYGCSVCRQSEPQNWRVTARAPLTTNLALSCIGPRLLWQVYMHHLHLFLPYRRRGSPLRRMPRYPALAGASCSSCRQRWVQSCFSRDIDWNSSDRSAHAPTHARTLKHAIRALYFREPSGSRITHMYNPQPRTSYSGTPHGAQRCARPKYSSSVYRSRCQSRRRTMQ